MTAPDLDERWVGALRRPPSAPDLDAAWAAVRRRSAAPQPTPTRRRRGPAVAAALVLVAAGLVAWRAVASGSDGERVRTDDPSTAGAGAWERLPDLPFGPRVRPSTFAIGDEVFVVGGRTEVCRTTICPPPTGEGRTDGAALDLSTGTWRQIAPAPVGLQGETAVVVGGRAYLQARASDEEMTMLRYDPAADAWSALPPPPGSSYYSYDLVAVGDRLVASGRSDVDRAQRDRDTVFDPARGTWSILPARPGPDLSTYVVVDVAGDALVVGVQALGVGRPERRVAARLDLATGRWEELPPDDDRIPASGAPWLVDGDRVVSVVEGRVLDLGTGSWSELPPPTGGAEPGGAIGADGAVYGLDPALGGSAFDLTAGRWRRIRPLPGATEGEARPTAVAGRDLVVLGGSRTRGARRPPDVARDVEMLTDVWIWRAP